MISSGCQSRNLHWGYEEDAVKAGHIFYLFRFIGCTVRWLVCEVLFFNWSPWSGHHPLSTSNIHNTSQCNKEKRRGWGSEKKPPGDQERGGTMVFPRFTSKFPELLHDQKQK